MTALEALALGTPIAHDVGGLREILSEYPEQLVKQHEAETYAEYLKTCMENSSPSNQLAHVYSAQKMLQRFLFCPKQSQAKRTQQSNIDG
ncbi:MAG: glycosyltransferase [Cellvibrio sp.]|nr:glycosyltransferase [Cellvibrio sp.]